MLFSEKPFLERFAAAAQAGFSGVEFPFPYAHSALDLAELCQQNNQQVVLFNLPPGDLEKGDRGLACDPQRRGEFQDSVGTALDYAEALQCRQLNCLAGVLPSGVSSSVASQTLVDNLHFAGVQLKRRGLTLLTEPINPIDIPGFFLNRTEPALALIEQVGLSNLRLQCDMYHMQVMGEDLATTIEAQIERIGHFQIADFPGRHEPGTGRMDYTRLLKLIENLDYSGWIGCEYHPEYDTVLGLAWMEAFR